MSEQVGAGYEDRGECWCALLVGRGRHVGGNRTTFSETFIAESVQVIAALDVGAIEACATGLGSVRDHGGRLFILGVG